MGEPVNDFGFTFADEMDIVIASEADVQIRLDAVVAKIIPFLENLKKNPEKDIIKWPNRESTINKFIQELYILKNGNGV